MTDQPKEEISESAWDDLTREQTQAVAVPHAREDQSERETVITPEGPTRKARPLPGAVGDYKIEGELGRGGMGAVYLAHHPRLDRKVALKILLAGKHASPQQRERFHLEAAVAARLRHTNIVTIHDVGEEEDCPFLVMELIPGESLSDRLRRDGPLPPREAAEICRKVADALQYAHGQSVLHRDVKPANIVLNADGEPLLTDFGLAKHLDAEGSGPTVSGQVLGTPAYMAPEQAHARLVDERSDVYALGATLYELLTGEPPFTADNVIELLAQLTSAKPETPRERLGRKIDRDLETICLTCLEKEPRHRYASAAALAEDLGRYLAKQTIVARPPSVWRKEWDAVRTNQRVSPITTIATIALALVLIWVVVTLNRLSEYQILAERLDSRSAGSRAEAAKDLVEHGGPAAAILLDAARRDPESLVRLAALRSLDKILSKKPNPGTASELRMILAREDLAPEERALAEGLLERKSGKN